VRELRVGSRLAISRRLPEPASGSEWADDRVGLLGQLVGDGSYLKSQPMRYSTASEDNSDFVARVARESFGAKVTRYRGRGAWHQLLISGNGNRWHPAGVNAWLRELGIFGQRSHQKRLPSDVFRLPDRQVALLLRHLWATDGCIHVRKGSSRGAHSVFFTTSSRGLADDVAALLLRFSIVARLRKVERTGSRPWWNVAVSGSRDQLSFLRSVGAFGPRVAHAEALTLALDGVVANTNVDTLPVRVFDQIRARMSDKGVTTREMATLRGTSYGGTSHFRFSPSRDLVAHYATLLQDEALLDQAGNDLFWDRVVDIRPAGVEDVYDLTVPGPSSWLAGPGIVSHNSGAIEQDSDLVVFIHRDDLDPEKKREAELILAKHRNGPTGQVRLHFEPSLTMFRNAARDQGV
jgi:replicative DNA helicase